MRWKKISIKKFFIKLAGRFYYEIVGVLSFDTTSGKKNSNTSSKKITEKQRIIIIPIAMLWVS